MRFTYPCAYHHPTLFLVTDIEEGVGRAINLCHVELTIEFEPKKGN